MIEKPKNQHGNIRYRPYNILKTSKKMVKIPPEKSIEIQNGITPVLQHRVYSGSKPRIHVKKDLMMIPDNQNNSAQNTSHSSNTNDS